MAIDDDLAGVVELAQRLTSKLASGRATQLSTRDMELMVLTGALRAITDAAASYSEQRTRERVAVRMAQARDTSPSRGADAVENAIAAARKAVTSEG
jgi:ribosomal 50S subunit-associated protein YjgA (DUF615 family)